MILKHIIYSSNVERAKMKCQLARGIKFDISSINNKRTTKINTDKSFEVFHQSCATLNKLNSKEQKPN